MIDVTLACEDANAKLVEVATIAGVPLIARSWDPGSEEVVTQGGNGRKHESERGRERRKGEKERGREKSVAFVCKMI